MGAEVRIWWPSPQTCSPSAWVPSGSSCPCGYREPRPFDELADGPIEMAPSRPPALKGRQAVLPLGHLGVGREAVFGKMQLTLWAQDPAHLAQGTLDIGDGAHGPGD